MREQHIYDYSSMIMLAAFVLGGALHVILMGVPFTKSIVQIYFGIVMVLWLMTLRVRMVDPKVRHILFGIAWTGIFFFMIQMGRYAFFDARTSLYLYAWYCYYIPMIIIPMLLFFLALSLNMREDEKIPWRYKLVLIPGVILILGFLTNNLHGWAFYSKGGPLDGVQGNYGYHGLYFFYVAFMVILSVIACMIILRKCQLVAIRRQSLLPLIFICAGLVLLIVSIFGKTPRICGVKVWQVPEIYVFMITCTVEALIQIGMIPSNMGYGKLFEQLKMSVEIRDYDGDKVMNFGEGLKQDEHTLIQSMPVDGGDVSWAIDMAKIYDLHKEMDEATEQIASRNDYLQTKNHMDAEQAALDSRNSLYTHITDIVKDQLEAIEDLLEDEEAGTFADRLAKISVLNAYIKRRSNMELLREGRETLPLGELKLAIHESLEYLKLCHVDAIVTSCPSCDLPGDMVTMAYTFFEAVIENCLDSITALMVTLTAQPDTLTMRILIQAETLSLSMPSSDAGDIYQKKVSITRQGEDTVIMYTLERGGGHR